MLRKLVILFILVPISLSAREPIAAQYRFGMELEFTAEHLAKFVNVFDMDHLQHSRTQTPHMATDFFDDYLRDTPNALAELDKSVRDQLTKGLQLNSLVQKPEPKGLITDSAIKPVFSDRKAPVLFNVSGQAMSTAITKPSTSSLVTSEPQKIPTELSGINQKKANGLLRPERLDWDELYKRWADLSFDQKQRLVRWENLGPTRKAELIIALDPEPHELPIKRGLPKDTESLFSRLSWGRDGRGVFEFRHSETNGVYIRTTKELVDDIRALSRLAGVERRIFNPTESRIKGVSLHYHISKDGEDLNPFMEKYNRLIAAKRLSEGIINDLRGGEYTFRKTVGDYGLIRRISQSRFEARVHVGPLEDELGFLKRALDAGPAGLEMIDNATKNYLAADGFKRIARGNIDFAANFEDLLTPEQKALYELKRDRLPNLRARLEEGDPVAWRRLPSLLKSNDPALNRVASRALIKNKWPDSFIADLPELVRTSRLDPGRLVEIAGNYKGPKEVIAVANALAEQALHDRKKLGKDWPSLLTELTWDEAVSAKVDKVLHDVPLNTAEFDTLITNLKYASRDRSKNLFANLVTTPHSSNFEALLRNSRLLGQQGQFAEALAAEALKGDPRTLSRSVESLGRLGWNHSIAEKAEQVMLRHQLPEEPLDRMLSQWFRAGEYKPDVFEKLLPKLSTANQARWLEEALYESSYDMATRKIAHVWSNQNREREPELTTRIQNKMRSHLRLGRRTTSGCIGARIEDL